MKNSLPDKIYCLQNRGIARSLKQRLPARVLELIYRIGGLAQQNGVSVYLVGGFIRDALLGVGNLDLDIMIEGDALSFARILKNDLGLKLVEHPKFATATVTLNSGFKIDLASARKECYPYPAALPVVTPGSVNEDLLRRDFSINAMACEINPDSFSDLIDFFNGKKDLREGKIRVLHDRSFIDDPTRILRAVRFEQRYNFNIEGRTQRLAMTAVKRNMLQKLSRFRITRELIAILKEQKPQKSLIRLQKLTGLGYFHPALTWDRQRLRQFNLCGTIIDQFKKTPVLENQDGWLVYFMVLTARLHLQQAISLSRDCCFSRQHIKQVEYFKQNQKAVLALLAENKTIPRHQLYQLLSGFSAEARLALMALAETAAARQKLRVFILELSQVSLQLKGEDLNRLKIKPGPAYKELLKQVFYAKLDGKIKSKADEISYLKRILRQKDIK